MNPDVDCRELLLQLLASLTLCDHMGDVSNDVLTVCNRLEIEWTDPEDGDEWRELARILHGMGVKTLVGTEVWSEDDD